MCTLYRTHSVWVLMQKLLNPSYFTHLKRVLSENQRQTQHPWLANHLRYIWLMLNATRTEVCINLTNTYNNRKFFFFIAENSQSFSLSPSMCLVHFHAPTLTHSSSLSANMQLNFPCELLFLESVQSLPISQEDAPSLTTFQEIFIWVGLVSMCMCVLIEWFNRCQSVNPSLFIFVFSPLSVCLRAHFFLHFFHCCHFFPFKQWRR